MSQKTITETAPILLKRNEEQISAFVTFKKDAEERISACLASFRDLDLGDLPLNSLNLLYHNEETIDNYLRERITGGKPKKIDGITLSAEKWRDLVEVPDYSSFQFELDHLKAINRAHKRGQYPVSPLNLADFEEIHGQAVMKEAVLESYIKAQSSYLSTPEDKEAYQLAIAALEKITQLSERFGIQLVHYEANNAALIIQKHQIGTGYKTSLDLHLFKRALDRKAGRIRY